MSLQDYDFGVSLSEIELDEGFKPLPSGEYQVQATKVLLKDTKSGVGKYLQFEFTLTDGQYTNRKVFQNVIVQHANEDARRIGLGWLKSWIMACNGRGDERLTLSLLYRFLNQPCVAIVTIEEGKSGFDDKNKIVRFKPSCSPQTSHDVPF